MDFSNELAVLKESRGGIPVENLIKQRNKLQKVASTLRSVLRRLRGEDEDTIVVRKVRLSENGNVLRGERTQQIQTICKLVGAGGKVFRTRDVLQKLREVEDELTVGVRSYTYTVLNKQNEEGFVTKAGRGKWVLT